MPGALRRVVFRSQKHTAQIATLNMEKLGL
jgi:hypothetical protein